MQHNSTSAQANADEVTIHVQDAATGTFGKVQVPLARVEAAFTGPVADPYAWVASSIPWTPAPVSPAPEVETEMEAAL